MQFDEFVKSLPIDDKAKKEAPANDADKVISAMLVGYDEKDAKIDFLGSSYKIRRADILDVTSATRPVVTSHQRGHAVQITIRGDAVLHAVSEYRASEFDQQRPFILQQPTQVPMVPLTSQYTPKEVAWLGARGLGHLASGRQGDLTITNCNINTPTYSASTCGTTSNVNNSQAVDDSQNDDNVQDDTWSDSTPDDQQLDGMLEAHDVAGSKQGSLTITNCTINTPTFSASTCNTTSNVNNSEVADDTQIDDRYQDDSQGDTTMDDQQMDDGF